MPLINMLTMTLGASVAKMVLSLWLKEPDLKVEGISGVVDSLFGLTGDIIAAQNGNNYYFKISQKAAELLDKFCEIEYKGWSDDQFEAVFYNAQIAIDNVQITPKMLVTLNLDVDVLKKQILKNSQKYKKMLNQDEIQLFNRLIEEASSLIIDYSSSLPNFTNAALSEILQRQDIIVKQIEEISSYLKQMQNDSLTDIFGNTDTRVLSVNYDKAIIRKLGFMQLFGADLSRASRKHSLSIAYINLSIRTHSNHNSPDISLKADYAINHARKLFIRGAAGSGKTTLLKWIAINAAEKTFTGHLEDWNRLTPFLIRLREHVDDEHLPTVHQFPSLIMPNITHSGIDMWVQNLLLNGDAIVLIDGVDEIGKRNKVKKWINDLADTFKNTRFIVTSRPLSSSDPWKTPRGFVEAELEPMQAADVTLFVKNWHIAVKDQLHNSDKIEEMDGLEVDLIRSINSNRFIRTISSNPLLCAMICALHRDSDRELPHDRLQLYAACTKMLIHEREVQRGIKVSNYPQFNYQEILELLSDLAYYLLDNGYSQVDKTTAIKIIRKTLRLFPENAKNYSPKKVLNYFIERTGMILEPDINTISFIHRTFQEYLAARAIVDREETGKLFKNATDPLWREVVILAAGLAGRKQKNQLLEELLTNTIYTNNDQIAVDMLAVACMETVSHLEPHLWEALNDRLKSLIPPKSLDEAKLLALAGDHAVKFLNPNNRSNAIMCIKTLELIGTESSVQVLLRYRDLTNQLINDAIIEALANIYDSDLGRLILSKIYIDKITINSTMTTKFCKYIHDINKLTLDNISDYTLDYLEDLSHLKILSIRNCPNLVSLDVIQQLPTLESLTIENCGNLLKIDAILNLNELKTLTLVDLPISQLPELRLLKNLKNLKIDNLPIINLPNFDNFKSLRYFTLFRCEQILDLDALKNNEIKSDEFKSVIPDSNAPSLEIFSLGWCPNIRNLDSLRRKRVLRKIKIYHINFEQTNINIKKVLERKIEFIPVSE